MGVLVTFCCGPQMDRLHQLSGQRAKFVPVCHWALEGGRGSNPKVRNFARIGRAPARQLLEQPTHLERGGYLENKTSSVEGLGRWSPTRVLAPLEQA